MTTGVNSSSLTSLSGLLRSIVDAEHVPSRHQPIRGAPVYADTHTYRIGDAIVIEPQIFAHAPYQQRFPDAKLMPGQTRLSSGA